jgi:hypothetical protein
LGTIGYSQSLVIAERGRRMSEQKIDEIAAEIEKIDSSILPILTLRDGPARLLVELPKRIPPRAGLDEAACRLWELSVIFFLQRGRLHEGLGLLWGLYENMLAAQSSSTRVHKGMPLVRLSDCFGSLGYTVHAKRYLMLTLCEDSLMGGGTIPPETTGTYFRMVWAYGMSHADLDRYAKAAYAFAQKNPDLALFPEAILQNMDDTWLSEMPTAAETSLYRINKFYAEYLVSQLGVSKGKALEHLAQYLMSCIPGCRVKPRTRSISTDYDLVCAIEGQALDFRSEFGSYFVCECKDWDSPADFTTMAKLCRVLDSTKARFGILFSKNGASDAALREQMKVFQDRGIVIIVIGLDDLQRVLSGENLVRLLRERYEAVRLDLMHPKIS